MEKDKNINNDFPLAEILVRLPIRSIAKSKSVCKRWKLLIESPVFRSLFVSLHKSSSCSWSLLTNDCFLWYRIRSPVECIASYGCKRWGLPRPLSSYIWSPPVLDSKFEIESLQIRASASGLLLIQVLDNMYYVGNPVLSKWVKIRPCTTLSLENYYYANMRGLVTREENGVVLGYKVVQGYTSVQGRSLPSFQEGATRLSFQVYSSETGKWTCEHVECGCPLTWSTSGIDYPISLNGRLYWVDPGLIDGVYPGGMVVLDFYNGGAKQFHYISLPGRKMSILETYHWSTRRACSTSGGFIVYIDAIPINQDHRLKIWKLNDLLIWERSWEINLENVEFGIDSLPLAMHPFDTHILYLKSREKKCLMSIDLRTQNSTLHEDSEYQSYDERCVKENTFDDLFLFQQYVPSPWMDDVPRPPPCDHCGRP
ncbi:unnamed protein product [Microthlaspi erraticum]|uniref:F-box domain-containing protein n=1 Tax=Microthlaspi erraticum TaxID=1685480 RepID=A0A6D2KEJ1_9BRAS|nr:unnamed protein product [Microthlaspi erraticum]